MTKEITITKEDIMKIISMNGAFNAKSQSRGRFNGSITYNELSVYEFKGMLRLDLRCRRCEDDMTIDEQEFHLTKDGWREMSQYSGEYHRPITNDVLDEIPWFWVSVRNADEEFVNYTNNLFKILK